MVASFPDSTLLNGLAWRRAAVLFVAVAVLSDGAGIEEGSVLGFVNPAAPVVRGRTIDPTDAFVTLAPAADATVGVFLAESDISLPFRLIPRHGDVGTVAGRLAIF